MKKILFLTHLYPYPPNEGGKIVSYNTLKYLSKYGHEVTVCTFYSEKEDREEIPLDIDLHLIPVDYANTLKGAFFNLFSTLPYNMQKYIKREMLDKVFEIIKQKKIDLVYVDHLHMAYYGKIIKKAFPQLNVVLRQHNVESQIMKRVAQQERNPLLKKYYELQYVRLYRYESEVVNYYNECFMITKEDLELMKNMNKDVKLSILPAGIDTTKYKPMNTKLVSNPTITFLGSMKWLPNINGIEWFMENVFPSLVKKIPDIKFYIVGKNPPEKFKVYKKKYANNIEITGFVEDERPYIATADVFIVPLNIGGGMRIKILNALAMKKAVVTTSIGAEGIELKDGSMVVADSPEDFLNSIIKLIKDKEFSSKISQLGFQEVSKKYSNKVILENHARYLDSMH